MRHALGCALLPIILVFSGCSEGGSASTASSSGLADPDIAYGASPVPTPSVVYQNDVVLVGGGAGAVRSVSSDGMVWTIKGTADHIADLTPGKILMASGLGVGRILAIAQVGGDRQVVLGPVDITDVVRDGVFDSSAPVSLDGAMAYATPTRPGLLSSTDDNSVPSAPAAPTPVDTTPAGTTAPQTTAPQTTAPQTTAPRTAAPESDPATVAPTSGDVPSSTPASDSSGTAVPGLVRLPTVEFTTAARPAALTRPAPHLAQGLVGLSPPQLPGPGLLPLPVSVPTATDVGAYSLTPFCCSGGTGVHLSYDHGGMRVSATITLHLNAPSVTFRLHIAAGKITDAGIELQGAAGIGIQFSAASTVGVKGDVARQRVQVPVAFTVPIGGFGLPLTARLEQTFSLSTAFASPGSISATGDYSFGGTIGFGIHGVTQTVSTANDFATQTSLLDSIQAVGIAPIGLIFGYQAKLTVGVGLLGFSAGAWLSMIARIGVTAAASEAAVPCRLAAINVGLGYGIGYEIPTPVATLVNIFLRTFGAPPIKARGGITGPYESIVNKSATLPAGASCQ